MKKITYPLLVLILIISSCTTTDTNSDNKNNWRSGTDGIRFNFMPDQPSSEVLSSQELGVIVEYTNKGASTANNMIFYLSGYDSNILRFASSSKSVGSLDGKDQYNTQGSQTEFVNWKTGISIPSEVDSFKQDITVTACYHYQTIANPNVCIDPNRYELVSSSKCKYDIEGLGSSQGGPIAVTSIKQKTTNDKVYLEIYFENKGNGNSFSPDLQSTNNCHTSIGINEIDTLEVEEVSMSSGSTRFSCKPTGTIRLTSGRGYIICEAPLRGDLAYTTPLKVVLDYNYRQSISKTVTIVNMG